MAFFIERRLITHLSRTNITSGIASRRSISTSTTCLQDKDKTEVERYERERNQLSLDVIGDEFDFSTKAHGYSGKSFNGIVATVFNGTSGVAKSLMARLGKIGSQVVIAYRGSIYDVEQFRIVGGLGQVYFAHYDLKDDESIFNAMRFSNVAVNFIGKETPTKNFSYNDVHVDGARRLARLAREAGVKKFIHFSALNASPNPEPKLLKNGSQFLKSKYYGELAVREEFPDAIIFRPADIVGERDNFINHFVSLKRGLYRGKTSLWDYYDGVEKQPVFMDDVIAAIDKAIFDKSALGKTFQAVGPYRYDFYELISYMLDCGGQGKMQEHEISNLRWDFPMRAAISIIEKFRKYPFVSWERVERDLTSDYIDPNLPTIEDLGVKLTPLEMQIQLLADCRPREHRFEIPYESAIRYERPRRLNAVESS